MWQSLCNSFLSSNSINTIVWCHDAGKKAKNSFVVATWFKIMSNSLAPIILFVFNRIDHTRQTVEALQMNELATESTLYVFADGAKDNATNEQRQKVQDVRDYIHTISGFKEIVIEESSKNKGLANSVIAGVTKVINQYGKVIVVEDDIVTHPFFLRFMNDCLEMYEKRQDIYMIGGHSCNIKIPWWYRKDIYIAHRSNSWGWATWVDRWGNADWNVSGFENLRNNPAEIDRFNRGGNDMFPMLKAQMEGKIDSWAIRWDYCMYKNDAYCVFPVRTLDYNVGFDGSGVHCGSVVNNFDAPMYDESTYNIKLPLEVKKYKKVARQFQVFKSTNGTGCPCFVERVFYLLNNRVRVLLKKVRKYCFSGVVK